MQNSQDVKMNEIIRDIELEHVLLAHKSIKECLVCSRQTSSSEDLQIAYIVTIEPLGSDDLQSYLQNVVPSHNVNAFVFLNSLPRDKQGGIDYETLFEFPVIDTSTLERIKVSINDLGNFPEITLSEEYYSEKADDKKSSQLPTYSGKSPASSNDILISEKPALVEGASLKEYDFPKNLSEYLIKASKDKSKGIHYINAEGKSDFVTYDSLLDSAKKILAGLIASGVKKHDKVVLQLENQSEFLKVFWACVLGNIAVLPMATLTNDDPESSQMSRLLAVLKVLDYPKFISDAKGASTLKTVLPDQLQQQILNCDELQKFAPQERLAQIDDQDLALLLLTSGSTGTPKLVTQTHEAIASRSYASALMNQFNDHDVFLNWFPLDHVGGIVMFHVQALSVGASQVQASMGRILNNPLEWLSLIEKYKATVTWAPNFAYGLVNQALKSNKDKQWNLSSMRFILNGGEAICADQAHTFMENLAPYGLASDSMHPSWGMSETCSGIAFSDSVVSQSINHSQPVIIGRPIAGVSFRIVNESNQLLKEGEVGLLQVKGEAITKGYFGNELANKEALTSDGWFNTGDQAVISQGQLTITGREKDVIIINGLNHSCGEIEVAIEGLDNIEASYTAAVGIRHAGSTTDQVVIFFVPKESNHITDTVSKIRRLITQQFSIRPDFIIPVRSQDIPKTSIGKIQRRLLKDRFEEGEYENVLRLLDPSSLLNHNTFCPQWQLKNLLLPAEKKQSFLFVTSALNPFSDIKHKLSQKGHECHIVEFGDKFQEVSEDYTKVDMSGDDNFSRLENIIIKKSITTIVDMRSVNQSRLKKETAQDIRAIQLELSKDLLQLIELCRKHLTAQRIVHCTTFSQSVDKTDVVIPAKASLIGLLKAARIEEAHLNVKHLDLDEQSGEDDIVRELLDENKDIEVAFRQGNRFVKNLRAIQTKPMNALSQHPIVKNGLYVITGGLGGIGFELAKHLLKEYNAKLLLIGRTEMPARHLWQQYLEDGLAEAKKINKFKQLMSIGKDQVIYASGDVSNMDFVRETLNQSSDFFNSSIHGIFHLAGGFEERSLAGCDEEHLSRVLDSKTLGAWNLYQYALTLEDQLTFVTFSSANAYFSGPNVGAYSAANIFLETLAHKKAPHIQHYCFAWSMWDDLGMSENYAAKELTTLKGYKLLNIKEGIGALFDALSQNVPSMIIGIDGNNPYMQSHIATPVKSLKQLKVRYKLSSTNSYVGLSAANNNYLDIFGHDVPVSFEKEENKNEISSSSHTKNIDEVLITIWKDILDIDDVELDDNFFDLGGHSLIMIKVQERIKADLHINLEVIDLFKYPTLRSLSQHLSQQNQPSKDVYEILKRIWSEVLEYDDIASDSNFFDLGGHSLIMIKVHEKIKQEINVDIEVIDLFKYPTLQSLAQFLKTKSAQGGFEEKLEQEPEIRRRIRRRQ